MLVLKGRTPAMTTGFIQRGLGHFLNRQTVRLGLVVLGLVLGLALPASLRAEVLTFRNDTKVPVVIQGTCVVRGKVVHDQPQIIQPGGTAKIQLPGNKTVTIYDAKNTNVQYFQGSIPGGNDDLYFSVQPDPATPGKAKCDQVKPPAGMPGGH
jgi:hypothetical protein